MRPSSWSAGRPRGSCRTGRTAHSAPVSRQLAQPGARVWADDRNADWLLWKLPQARGRIALDIRYELLSKPQFEDLVAYHDRSGEHWRTAARGYGTIVLDPRGLAKQDLRRYGATLYDDGKTAVLRNPDRG